MKSPLPTIIACMASTAVMATPIEASTEPPSCLPTGSLCGVEVKWIGGAIAFRPDLASPQDCWDYCQLKRRFGVCESFVYDSSNTCYISEKAAADVGQPSPGSGVRIWDKECWPCGATPTETVPSATSTTSIPTSTASCLSPTAVCEKEAVWRGGQDLAHYGQGVGFDHPLGCWELCDDKRRPPRCKSFTWNPITKVCLLYDKTGVVTHETKEGTGVWLYDKECWTCKAVPYL